MKPRISLIVAVDSINGIGKKGKIPWHIKEDLVRLKNLTKGRIVILGRKTYESMVWYYDRSGRPMPAKLYIVITHDEEHKTARENVKTAHSLDEALENGQDEEVFILGGAQIFQQAIDMGIVDRLYLTQVEGDFNCDTFFPDYSDFNKMAKHLT